MTESEQYEQGRESEASVPWAGRAHLWFNRVRFLRRARPIVGLDTDGNIQPMVDSSGRMPVTVVGISGFGTLARSYFSLTAAGNLSPAWTVDPLIPSTAMFKVLSAIYSATGVIAAPGVTLTVDGENVGPSSGATTATSGQIDLSPRSELVVTFAQTFAVTSGTAGDAYVIRVMRVS
jgi:hypothetical protein